VNAQLQRFDKGANHINFSIYLEDKVFNECLAEVRKQNGWELKKDGIRNEQFDLLSYGLANIKYIESKLPRSILDWNNPPPFAREWDHNIKVSGATIDNTSNMDRIKRVRG